MSTRRWIKVNDSEDKSKSTFPICTKPAENKTVYQTQWGDAINWGWEFFPEMGKYSSCVTELSPKPPAPPPVPPPAPKPAFPPAPKPAPKPAPTPAPTPAPNPAPKPAPTPAKPAPTPATPPKPAPKPQKLDLTYYNHMMSVLKKFDGSIFVNRAGSYGWETVPGLARNKQRIWSVIERSHGADKNLYYLILALGMLETKTMNVSERDNEKDKLGWQTASYTFMNLCGDLIVRAKPENNYNIYALGGSPLNEDTDFQIDAAIQIFKGGLTTLGGILPYCNFVRGGWSGWNSPGDTWDLFRMGQYYHGLSLSLQKISANEQGIADTNSDKRFWIRFDYV